MALLLPELERRWTAMFNALAAGEDAPPAQRLRAEGMMESALLVAESTAGHLDDTMDACYRKAFGRSMETDFGANWRDFFPFPQIPAMGARAPVYPSTSE